MTEPSASDVIDERMIGGLHVEAMRRQGLAAEHVHGEVFQASTIDALFEGDFDGDLTLDELAEHGDLGLGTVDALDGELILLDGRFLRADIDGNLSEVDRSTRTPFAVVTFFDPVVRFAVTAALSHDELVAAIDERAPSGSPTCAVRIDGEFEHIQARSVPRQRRPYPSLSEITHSQHVFDFADVEGTMVGFRFPDYAQGLEVAGYHLHFADRDRRRGGHVLSCRPRRVEVQIDRASELRVELPPGVELGKPDTSGAKRERIREVEGGNWAIISRRGRLAQR